MKPYLKSFFALLVFAFLAPTTVLAEHEEKMIIALKADDFEMSETDISDLAIGESQTIETESGKIIDILRTEEGAEIYVDGELLEMDFSGDALHEEHMMQKHVEVICDNDEDTKCNDKMVWISEGDDVDLEKLHEMHLEGEGQAHKVIIVKKHKIVEE